MRTGVLQAWLARRTHLPGALAITVFLVPMEVNLCNGSINLA